MATSKRQQVSHSVVNKVFGIDVNARYSEQPLNLERVAYETLDPADIFLEDEPTVLEFLKELRPSVAGIVNYFRSLFPAAGWIGKYNAPWLLGDVIAGITIGLVVVPQAMAYALLAQLPPAFGLYTSFTGAVLYWLFGTSKDIVIGTTAVGSLLVGQVVTSVNDSQPGMYTNQEIAHALSMLCGAVLLFFGLFRLGWIIEFIPYIPISAFVTGASVTIMSTQIPTMLGIPNIDTHDAPYMVLINTLRGLPQTRLDAAIGISSLVILFAIKGFCNAMERRQPERKRMWSFINSLRLTFVMLLFTLISYLVNRGLPIDEVKFRIVGNITPGFEQAGVPKPKPELLRMILPQMPAVAIILVIEHIAIAKAMGRLYGYTITPSQEIVALGAANMFSPFVGGYVCTGSFGASAVLSKAGVRTPLAGMFSALVLVLALYALTAVFYYIPNAALAGLIVHAVCNLLAPPKKLYKYWQLSPLELFIWVIGVVLAVFESLEVSIYTGIILSLVLMLVRLARTRGQFLGTVRAKRVVGEKGEEGSSSDETRIPSIAKSVQSERDVYVPITGKSASNSRVAVESPYPGVFIYRFTENLNYSNQARHVDTMLKYIMENTRRMSEEHYEKESDRLWCDPGPRSYKCDPEELPYLRAIVFDCSAVNNLDVTTVQGLIDLRNTLTLYSAPDAVEWHLANIQNRWARRALAVAGFGFPIAKNPAALSQWKPFYSIAATVVEDDVTPVTVSPQKLRGSDEEDGKFTPTPDSGDTGDTIVQSNEDDTVFRNSQDEQRRRRGMAAVYSVDRPFFHGDLQDAVESAVMDARNKDCKLGL